MKRFKLSKEEMNLMKQSRLIKKKRKIFVEIYAERPALKYSFLVK